MHNMFDQIFELSLFTDRVVLYVILSRETESKRACFCCEIWTSGFEIYASK